MIEIGSKSHSVYVSRAINTRMLLYVYMNTTFVPDNHHKYTTTLTYMYIYLHPNPSKGELPFKVPQDEFLPTNFVSRLCITDLEALTTCKYGH